MRAEAPTVAPARHATQARGAGPGGPGAAASRGALPRRRGGRHGARAGIIGDMTTTPRPALARRPRGLASRSTLLILAAALAAGLGLWASQHQFGSVMPAREAPAVATEAVTLFPQTLELPAFALEQSDGTVLENADLLGRWTVVFIGFTHCPDICPTTLGELATAQRLWAGLPAATRPQVLFVSVDPRRDTAARAGEYAAFFHADTIAGSGALEPLTEFARSLGLVFMEVDDGNGGLTVDHSSALAVIDPQGRRAGLIRPPLDARAIARDLALLGGTPLPAEAEAPAAAPAEPETADAAAPAAGATP